EHALTVVTDHEPIAAPGTAADLERAEGTGGLADEHDGGLHRAAGDFQPAGARIAEADVAVRQPETAAHLGEALAEHADARHVAHDNARVSDRHGRERGGRRREAAAQEDETGFQLPVADVHNA